jgi:hypothetical protein
MGFDCSHTYWAHKGRYQALANALEKLVPLAGPVSDPMLDEFRRACNAYHDLYNNGGGNRNQDIIRFTKCYAPEEDPLNEEELEAAMEAFEPVMDNLILAAAAEQLGKLPEANAHNMKW